MIELPTPDAVVPHVAGDEIRSRVHRDVDFVVIGSGPAGASAARRLSRGGAKVVVLEAGPAVAPRQYVPDGFGAMSQLYRELGGSLLLGAAPMPYIQGKALGGTAVINGAICWRLPQDVWSAWMDSDPALETYWPWEAWRSVEDEIWRELNIAATHPDIALPNNNLLAAGAESLGIEHRPIQRNVAGCRGLGRCLQGCPEGNKITPDRHYLWDAADCGTEIFSETEVVEIRWDRRRRVARGVRARARGGGEVAVRARKAVVVAASCIQSPMLLWSSGIRHGPVGRHFQCHPGISVGGRFAQRVALWVGATQGHEVIGLRNEGLKFEALGYDMALLATRLKGFGSDLSHQIADIAHWANWGAAIRARATGRVKPGRRGRATVRFNLSEFDLQTVRRGVAVLGQMMLAAGAEFVTPGIFGWDEQVSDPNRMAAFETDGPRDPRAYTMVVTHMFGTTRMGTDPRQSVVDGRGAHHRVRNLYVVDSSVFPTSTGVNPQISIMTVATRIADGILAHS